MYVLCVPLYGQSIILEDADQTYLAIDHLSLWKEDGVKPSLSELSNKRFVPFSELQDRVPFEGAYWGMFELLNQQKENDWIIEFPINLTDVEIYALLDGVIHESRTGQFVPIEQRTFVPVQKANLVKFSIQETKKATIYFRSQNERKGANLSFGLRIYSADFYFNKIKDHRFRQGLFIGFIMMMLIYNLFLYFFNARDKTYVYYSIYIFGIVLYSTYNSGELAYLTNSFFLPDHPKYAYLGKTSVYLIIFAYLRFLRSYFNFDRVLDRWNKIMIWVLIINIISFFTDIILMILTNFNSEIADIVTVGNAIVFVLFVFTIGFVLFRKRIQNSSYISIGIILMGVGSVITIIARMNGVDYTTVGFQIGTVLEIIIFSMGLAARRRSIELEKQTAFQQLQKSELLRIEGQKDAERIKEMNRLRSNLYANITHEFRTPLTVINGNLEFIDGHASEKSTIKRNSEKMLRLVNQILDVSKMEANMYELHMTQGNIIDHLRYLTASLNSYALSNEIKLSFESEVDQLDMDFDTQAIEHIMYNLVSNAVKFTPTGGTVNISVRTNDHSFIEIKVTDSGRGIESEMKSKIFDRYRRANSSSNNGTGIGLSFVKELVDLLNGSVSVKSELGKGSEFMVFLPISNKAEFDNIGLSHEDETYSDVSSTDQKPLQEGSQPILLIIEDNRDVIAYLERILSSSYRIHVCLNGNKGIEKAIVLIPDLIICDVMMPGKDGYEVTAYLKEDLRTNHIPLLMLTARTNEHDKLKGLMSGADNFMIKPFSKDELIVRLNNMIRKQELITDKIKRDLFRELESDSSKTMQTKEDPFISLAQNKVIEKLEDVEYSAESLSRDLNLTLNQLKRKLNATIGLTPLKFVREIRLARAKELLLTDEHNISEVAYMVGFKDPNYFSRIFQKENGLSPRDYIQRNSKASN